MDEPREDGGQPVGEKTHMWHRPKGLPWTCCKKCGVVLRRDGGNANDPCRGKVRVGPR